MAISKLEDWLALRVQRPLQQDIRLAISYDWPMPLQWVMRLLLIVAAGALLLSASSAAGEAGLRLVVPAKVVGGVTAAIQVVVANGLDEHAWVDVFVRSKSSDLAVSPTSRHVELAPGESQALRFELQREAPSPREMVVVTAKGWAGPRELEVQQGVLVLRSSADMPGSRDAQPSPLLLGTLLGAGMGVGASAGLLMWWREAWFRIGVTAPVAALYTRIRKDGALSHPTRRLIYDIICRSPGVHAAAVQSLSGKSAGTAWHHLRVLETQGLIVARDEAGFRKFFPVHHAPRPIDLLSPQQRLVYDEIPEEGATQIGLAASLGVTRQAVNQHVMALRAKGLVELRRVGEEWRCFRTAGE